MDTQKVGGRIVFASLLKRVFTKMRTNTFLLEKTAFQNQFICRRADRKSQNVFLVQNDGNLPFVSSHLKLEGHSLKRPHKLNVLASLLTLSH